MSRQVSWMSVATLLALVYAITAPMISGFVFGFVHGPLLILPLSVSEALLLLTMWAFMFLAIRFTAWCAERSDRGVAAMVGLVFSVGGLSFVFMAGSTVQFSEMMSAEAIFRLAVMTSPAVVTGAVLRERLAPAPVERPSSPSPKPEPPERGPTLPRAA